MDSPRSSASASPTSSSIPGPQLHSHSHSHSQHSRSSTSQHTSHNSHNHSSSSHLKQHHHPQQQDQDQQQQQQQQHSGGHPSHSSYPVTHQYTAASASSTAAHLAPPPANTTHSSQQQVQLPSLVPPPHSSTSSSSNYQEQILQQQQQQQQLQHRRQRQHQHPPAPPISCIDGQRTPTPSSSTIPPPRPGSGGGRTGLDSLDSEIVTLHSGSGGKGGREGANGKVGGKRGAGGGGGGGGGGSGSRSGSGSEGQSGEEKGFASSNAGPSANSNNHNHNNNNANSNNTNANANISGTGMTKGTKNKASGDPESSGGMGGVPPPKRHKTSKACLACRQQKSRCDPDTTENGLPACRRCLHFHMVCSLTDPSAPPVTSVNSSGSGAQPKTRPYPARQRVSKPKKGATAATTAGGGSSAGASDETGRNGGIGSGRPSPEPGVMASTNGNGSFGDERMMTDGGNSHHEMEDGPDLQELYVSGRHGQGLHFQHPHHGAGGGLPYPPLTPPTTSAPSSRFKLPSVLSPFSNNLSLPPPAGSPPSHRRHHAGIRGERGDRGIPPSPPPTSLPPIQSPPISSALKTESPPSSYRGTPQGIEAHQTRPSLIQGHQRRHPQQYPSHGGNPSGGLGTTSSSNSLSSGGGIIGVGDAEVGRGERGGANDSLYSEDPGSPHGARIVPLPPPLSLGSGVRERGDGPSGAAHEGVDWRGNGGLRGGGEEDGYGRTVPLPTSSVRTGSGESDERDSRDGYHHHYRRTERYFGPGRGPGSGGPSPRPSDGVRLTPSSAVGSRRASATGASGMHLDHVPASVRKMPSSASISAYDRDVEFPDPASVPRERGGRSAFGPGHTRLPSITAGGRSILPEQHHHHPHHSPRSSAHHQYQRHRSHDPVSAYWERSFSFVKNLVKPDTNKASRDGKEDGNDDVRDVDDDRDELVKRGVVSVEEGRELENIWNNHLSPWVSQDPPTAFFTQPSASDTAFSQVIRLYLAAEHLRILSPSSTAAPFPGDRGRKEILQSLEAEVQRHLFHVVLGGSMDPSAIKALHALSLFADALSVPLFDGGVTGRSKVYDGEILMSSAMRMASSLRLEADFEAAVMYAEGEDTFRGARDLPGKSREETLERSRLLCNLLISDVILQIGKGRVPVTRVPLRQAETIFGNPAQLVTRRGGGSDARLVLQCKLLDATLQALKVCVSEHDLHEMGVERWADTVDDGLRKLDWWHGAFAPIAALSEPEEALQMTIIRLQYHFCRITILIRSFLLLRKCWLDWSEQPVREPYDESRFSRFAAAASMISGKWVAQLAGAGEALLIEALSLRRPTYGKKQPWSGMSSVNPPPPLAFAPDCMCWMVMFAPVLQIKTNIIYMSVLDRPVQNAQARRGLLSKILDTLREAVPVWVAGEEDGNPTVEPPSTLPARCMDALTALIKLWDIRTEECKGREMRKAANKSNAQAKSLSSKDAAQRYPGSSSRGHVLNLDQVDDERDELESDTEDPPAHSATGRLSLTTHGGSPSLRINDSGNPSQPPTSSASSTAVANDTSEPLDLNAFTGFDLSVFENAPSFLDSQMLSDPNFAVVLDPQYMGQTTPSFGY